MGIWGLTTLLAHNSQVFRSHRLHDCQLVIDGNNLLYNLYTGSHFDSTTGGNYDDYYATVKDFFARLRQCNISPYVILDGSHPKGPYAILKAMQRAEFTLTTGIAISRCEMDYMLHPIFVKRVFLDVLRDIKVPFVICDAEGDGQVTALANMLGCPALSHDSDFYVHDVKGGFLSYERVEFDVKRCNKAANGRKCHYMNAKIFYQPDFLNNFGEGFTLNVTTFRLFAALYCWEITERLTMPALHRLVKERSQSGWKCKLVIRGYKERQLLDMLYGLRFLTRSEAMDAAVAHLNHQEKIEFKEMLNELFASYSPKLQICLDLLGLSGETPDLLPTLPSYTGELLPPWFVRRSRTGELLPFVLQIVAVRWLSFVTRVEQFKSTSTADASLHLRRIMYCILIGHDATGSSEKPSVMEICRNGTQIERHFVFPYQTLPNGDAIPPLHSLPSLTVKFKRKFVLGVLLWHADDAAATLRNILPDEWHLFVASLMHWMHYTCRDKKQLAANDETLQHLDCILVTAVYYNTLQGHIKVNRGKLQIGAGTAELKRTFGMILDPNEVSLRHRCEKKLNYFRKLPRFSKQARPDLDIVHALVQFQTIFADADELNRLLDMPLRNVHVYEFINFPFAYNVCCYLKDHWSERDQLLEKWLGSSASSIHVFFQGVRNFIMSTVLNILEHPGKGSKRRTVSKSSVSSLH